MTSLESLVPSLALCQQLQAAGFPQDTVMVWVFRSDALNHYSWVTPRTEESDDGTVSAPTAGEIDDWLREKVGNPLEETTVIVSHDGSKEVAYCAGVRSAQGKYQIAYGDTDIAARAALVLEVAG